MAAEWHSSVRRLVERWSVGAGLLIFAVDTLFACYQPVLPLSFGFYTFGTQQVHQESVSYGVLETCKGGREVEGEAGR